MGYGFLTGVQKQTFNENLLINPDFTINQRGEASYTLGASRTYTVDRWSLFYNASIPTATVAPISGGGVSFSCTTTSGGNINIFGQDIENFTALRGKVVTLSVKVSSISGTFKIGIYDGTNIVRTNTITNGVTKLTLRVPVDCTRFLCYLTVNATGDNSCVIEWAKLEYGANNTDFCAPDPATEIVRCQRFFYIIKKADNYTEYGMGWTNSLYNAICGIDVPTMRTTPTLLVSANGDFSIRNGANNINATSPTTPPTLRAYVGKTAFAQFSTTLAMVSDYALCSLRSNVVGSWIAFDAEIY